MGMRGTQEYMMRYINLRRAPLTESPWNRVSAERITHRHRVTEQEDRTLWTSAGLTHQTCLTPSVCA
ncbi:hypothetical protein AAFF_G00260550 [Aldrovandia affinis]|uniref:Uncharacterized protein n=1 Tax=Aldrovandia affinis TaxID=143900 RepID=A0AAD7RC75_9TELE|nr:hypothetical protein AAFF_G00260550 [Aldrovandia affinis]